MISHEWWKIWGIISLHRLINQLSSLSVSPCFFLPFCSQPPSLLQFLPTFLGSRNPDIWMNSIHGVSVRVLLGELSTSDKNQVNCHLKRLSTENLNRTAIMYCLVFKNFIIINALTHISIVIRNHYLWRIISDGCIQARDFGEWGFGKILISTRWINNLTIVGIASEF